MKYIHFSLLFSLLILSSCATSQNYTVGFYNVENLFDTKNDPTIDDEDFLPESENEWNSERYETKLKHLVQVTDQMENLLALGMVEIENAHVIRDFMVASPRFSKSFGLVHFDCEDARGIDVALIYDSTKMTLFQKGILRFDLETEAKAKTRDILWAKFYSKKDTLFFMINHWPSRRGGEEASEVNRLKAAGEARKFIDSLQNIQPKAKIIFMGDLNDYPDNKAPQLIAEKLNPQITKKSGEFGGTYNYKGEWDVLDHIFTSPALETKKKISLVPNSGKIYSPAFLLETYKGNIVPFRTYAGKKYLGGYSDHLPVSIEIKLP